MRFDDDEYLDDFYVYGNYPKIHNDIFSMHKYVPAHNVIDLGCCYGLLSHRLSMVYDNVVGIEASAKYLEKAILKKNIKYAHLEINEKTIMVLCNICKTNHIDGVFARRVIPEIYETGGISLVSKLVNVLYECGIQYIVLEGRKSNRNAVNPLHSIEQEHNAFSKHYKCIKKYRECEVLEKL